MFIKATASHNLCAILLYHTKGTYSRISSKTSTFSRVRNASRAYGGRAASFAPMADARRLSAPTADARRLFAPTADARRLSAPTADAQRLFAPTADARRLSAPTAFPTKTGSKEFAFRSTLEALQKHTAKNLSFSSQGKSL